ncbi:S-adenosyl-L-methionine-dependent methyltransferase [Syncephalis fuscata]|nr:S-adenosyl-L-methionine-dependent methyltransferase [Syncephalis fuscata]
MSSNSNGNSVSISSKSGGQGYSLHQIRRTRSMKVRSNAQKTRTDANIYSDDQSSNTNIFRSVPASMLDYESAERADLMHEMVHYVQRRNFIANIDQPKKILDVGCGTGRWEMARDFPKSRITGCEMLPIFSTQDMPKNVKFELGSVLQGLPFLTGSFDYVHMRFFGLDVPAGRWPSVISELYRVCKPGGIIEICETDGIVRQPAPTSHVVNGWMSAMAARNEVELGSISTLDEPLSDVGFIDIVRRELNYPLGEWAGAVGTIQYRVYRSVLDSCRSQIVSNGNLTDEALDEILEEQMDTLERYQSHVVHYVYTARRPSDDMLMEHTSSNGKIPGPMGGSNSNTGINMATGLKW